MSLEEEKEEKEGKDEKKFIIEGNPGQNNTYVNIATVGNYNPNATSVTNNVTNNYYGVHDGETPVGSPKGKKINEMTIRDLFQSDMMNTESLQKNVLNYVSCIRRYLKVECDKSYMKLWCRIMEHELFKVELYIPGKQACQFNRNLIGNIIHYLDSKGFYKAPYNSSEMARALEGDDQNPIRKALRFDPDVKYCQAIDAIIKELKGE